MNKFFTVKVMYPGGHSLNYKIQSECYDVSEAGFYTIRDEKNDKTYMFPVMWTIIEITKE